MRTIDMIKTDTEDLSVEKYLSLSVKDKAAIKSTKIVPPSLDGNDFGKIRVKYKVPTYKVAEFS